MSTALLYYKCGIYCCSKIGQNCSILLCLSILFLLQKLIDTISIKQYPKEKPSRNNQIQYFEKPKLKVQYQSTSVFKIFESLSGPEKQNEPIFLVKI